jgi:glycosyltransferase involved in cell wall biosynthesis
MTMPKIDKPAHRETACLSYVHPAEVSAFWHDSIVELLAWDFVNGRQVRERISLTSGPRIASARNEVVREFLGKRSSEWLVMVDADMVFAPDTIHRMIAAARRESAQVVGALCYGSTATGVMNPTIFRLTEDDKGRKVERFDDAPPRGMIKCDATGTGFILIHRDVLMTIGEAFYERDAWPWFSEGSMRYDDRWVEYGEDVGFCLRARIMGIDVWVNSEVEVHHAKTKIITPADYRRYRKELKAGVTKEDRMRQYLIYNNEPQP